MVIKVIKRFLPGNTGVLLLVLSLTGLLLVIMTVLYVYRIREVSHRPSISGAQAASTQSTIVRNDIVVNKKGRKFRRVVRVDRNAKERTITTTVEFTDIKSGGVGVATYIEPEVTPVQSFFASNRRLDGFVFVNGKRLGLNRPPLGRRYPLLSIPEPMEPGQKWKVRLVRTARGGYSEGSGKAPRGASLKSVTLLPNIPMGTDTYYGQGVTW